MFNIIFKDWFRFLKPNKAAWLSAWVLTCIFIVAILADFISYPKPFICTYKGELFFPIFQDYLSYVGLHQWKGELSSLNWREAELGFSIWPIIPYGPNTLDSANAPAVSPWGSQILSSWYWRHWLGTDLMGRDILSGIIHGARVSLSVAFVAVSVATIIGIFMGGIAGFYGDHSLKIPIIRMILMPLILFFSYFYAFYIRKTIYSFAFQSGVSAILLQLFVSLLIILAIFTLFYALEKFIIKITKYNKETALAVDFWISRLIELKIALPTLLLILTISSIAKPSLLLMELIIGLTSWTGIARLVRAEMLKIKNLPYIEAGNALGFSNMRLLFLHALRNAMTPVYVSIAFAMASAILLESSLSFLGLGVPIEYVTWGSLLQSARQDFSAWWLALFPGFMIFITNMVFNLLGEGIRDYLDPRQNFS